VSKLYWWMRQYGSSMYLAVYNNGNPNSPMCAHNNILWPSEFCREAPSFILKACFAVKLKLLVTLLWLSLSSVLRVLVSFPPVLLEGLPFSFKLGLRLHSGHNEAQKTNKKAKETDNSSWAHTYRCLFGVGQK